MPERYTELGSRMKAYEGATGNTLPRYLPYVIRVDVRAAHSLLRDADKPFDMRFVGHMQDVMSVLCREVQGAVLGYQQSDEVSVLACTYDDYRSEPWFGGRTQKIASVAAGLASASLAVQRHLCDLPAALAFDARVFALPNVVEVANYFVWRQRDAQRNAVSMAAQARFSHKQLYQKNRDQMIEMLAERGVFFENYPDTVRSGSACAQDPGGSWACTAAPQFVAASGSWLTARIPPMPSFEEESDAPDPAAVHRAVREYFPAEVLRDLAREAAEDD